MMHAMVRNDALMPISVNFSNVALVIVLPLRELGAMNSRRIFADLRVLATSDVHMHVSGWDALRDRTVPGTGMTALATVIRAERASAPGACLLFDNGDALQGTPVGDICTQPLDGQAHPWSDIIDNLGYDAVGLGNHDFDFGLGFLERVIAGTSAKVLCASIAAGALDRVQPGLILRRELECSDAVTREICIGVTSVLPPQTALWNHRHLDGRIAFSDGIGSARRAVQALRRDGADIVVVLCHSGLPEDADADNENFAADLAEQVPGVDAMIMGHTHRLFPTPDISVGPNCDQVKGTVHGVPAVMPGFGAEHLGIIDLKLAWSPEGWSVAGHEVRLADPPRDAPEDPAISAIAAPAIAATRASLDATIAQTDIAFHSYFEMLQSGPSTQILADAMMLTISDHVAGTELANLPLIASVSSMAMGGRAGPANFVDVPAGDIQERHLAMLCPYPNAIWATVLTGAELTQWAERSAAYFNKTRPECRQLVNPSAPSFNFDSLFGLETVIDPCSPPRYSPGGLLIDPAGRRVAALLHKGDAVADDAEFLVAMTSYRGAGGGLYPGQTDRPIAVRTDIEVKAALRSGLGNGELHITQPASVWRFADRPETPVIVETAPTAMRYLDDIAQFNPEPLGETASGFLQLRVSI
jgi:2',3'-cyclic-nucleotide 2'-phosphodiesterase / 3'-nucleotidase